MVTKTDEKLVETTAASTNDVAPSVLAVRSSVQPPFPWLTGVNVNCTEESSLRNIPTDERGEYFQWDQSGRLSHSLASSSTSFPSSSSFPLSIPSLSSSSQCEIEIWSTVSTCVDLVLNLKTFVNKDKKAEVEVVDTEEEKEKEKSKTGVQAVTREEFDVSLQLFQLAIETLHSTLFREEIQSKCSGISKYLAFSLTTSSSSSTSSTAPSSSSSSDCVRGVAEEAKIEREEEGGKEILAIKRGMLSPNWLRAVSMAVRTAVCWCTILLTSIQGSLPLFAEEGVERARKELEEMIRTSSQLFTFCSLHNPHRPLPDLICIFLRSSFSSILRFLHSPFSSQFLPSWLPSLTFFVPHFLDFLFSLLFYNSNFSYLPKHILWYIDKLMAPIVSPTHI